jgi:hypothetical protein
MKESGNGKNQDQKESPPVKNTSALVLIAEFSYKRDHPQPHCFLDTRIPKQCLPKSQAKDGIAGLGEECQLMHDDKAQITHLSSSSKRG